MLSHIFLVISRANQSLSGHIQNHAPLGGETVGAFEIWQSTDSLCNGVKLHFTDAIVRSAFESELRGASIPEKSEHLNQLMAKSFRFAEQAIKVLVVTVLLPEFDY